MNIDYELLNKQRQALVRKQFNLDYDIPIDVVDGLVNLLDALLDEAEEEGFFVFPTQDSREK